MTNPPTWALFDVDLATTDEDELSALIDDVIDSGKSLAFRDTTESDEIRAVCISYEAYVGLISRATSREITVGILPKPGPTQEQINTEIARDVARDAIR